MSNRRCNDWMQTYIQYSAGTEAPRILHFWCGITAMAGALRRKVWFDQIRFKWYPSFYVCLVADPGIATKSTTADMAMDLLRAIPGIKFGPDAVTWQSLVTSFASSCESFEWNGEYHPMSPITLLASEFGNLMDLNDKDMVNLFITLWDGRSRYEKETKMSGNDTIEAPWINMLACTTPSWMADNMSRYMTGGGLTSRIIYVFADRKENYAAYLDTTAPKELVQLKEALIQDLEYISMNLCGPLTLTPGAREWGVAWYENLWTKVYSKSGEDWWKGYLARKQTHLHKLAMVLSISRGDSMLIELEDLTIADTMLAEIEREHDKVFANVGKSESYIHAQKFLALVKERGSIPYAEVHKVMMSAFPDARDFDGILATITRMGAIKLDQRADGFHMVYVGA